MQYEADSWDPWAVQPDGNCAGFIRDENGAWSRTPAPPAPPKTIEHGWSDADGYHSWHQGWKPWNSQAVHHYGEPDLWSDTASSCSQSSQANSQATSYGWEKPEAYTPWEQRQPELFLKKKWNDWRDPETSSEADPFAGQ